MSPLFEYGLRPQWPACNQSKGVEMPQRELYADAPWVLLGTLTPTALSLMGNVQPPQGATAGRGQTTREFTSPASQIRHRIKERTNRPEGAGSQILHHSPDFLNHIQGSRTWVS